MSGDWKPGTVAKATVRGVPNVRIVRGDGHWALAADTDDFITDRNAPALIADVRPLVVLDLDDPRLSGSPDVRRTNLLEHLRKGTNVAQYLADQIEAQTRPPRIPEPGLWGVVEAHTEDGEERRRFVRHDDAHDGRAWERRGVRRAWDELIDPVLVREGVSE
jgi:hypothetical protein